MEHRRIQYIDDYFDSSMLYVSIVRSQVERGNINMISYPDPPDGMFVLGAQDIPGENRIHLSSGKIPLLAEGVIRYLGQPVLLIAGENRRDMDEFARYVSIDYRNITVLPPFENYFDEQVIKEHSLSRGNPGKVLKTAFQVLEGNYYVDETLPWSLDAQGAFARFEDGRLVVYSSTQWLHHVQSTVARVLSMRQSDITVRRTAYSAQFDEKLWYPSFLAAYAALASSISGKSAKLVLSANELLYNGPRGTPVAITHRSAMDKNGNLAAIDVTVNLESGAFPVYSDEALQRASAAAAGNYTCENVSVTTRLIETTRRPLDFSPGAGLAGCFFASETHASLIAEVSQTDPLNWKLRNLNEKESPLAELLSRAAAASDFSRKHAAYELAKKRRSNPEQENRPLRGIGIAGVYQGNGFFGRGEETERFKVTARLESEGDLYIYTSGLSGIHKTASLAQRRAAEILGVPRDGVHIINDDTDRIPDSGPSGLSRNITVVYRLVERCCEAIKKKRFRNPLPIEASRSFRMPAKDRWEESQLQGSPYAARTWAACVVELELNPILLEKSIRGVWVAVDCGEVLHRHRAESSLETGILHAIEGCTVNLKNLEDPESPFHLPNLLDIPPVSISFSRNSRQKFPSGIGDLPYIMIPPAFTAALSQASGVYFDRFPLPPRKIHQYMEGA
ncbi:molybdopterin cofactor-binding domain-containing protein [Marispirochaeta sp.]|jgi:CO/xanthine dehydrogenase Mo-binding subunit|uniref:xanthine dehydrogenase family protein molybdopterin-binding subunit n=1 Tax=Marispirochaeta sp. TaxID=2038653 RepID=UPI0029C8A90E|nr:molybdopterin cofactor-binding domain-containing protein [Marispirochaeta sp.]